MDDTTRAGRAVFLYDAFTDRPFAGSQAAVISGAEGLEPEARAMIARELGFPATAFVDGIEGRDVKVQFFSTVMELPMCGHGTLCLVTHLVESGVLPRASTPWTEARLLLPNGAAGVRYRLNRAGRVEVMLQVAVPEIVPPDVDLNALGAILRLPADKAAGEAVRANADFRHLCLPVMGRAALDAMVPDFDALGAFCRAHGIDTVACYATDPAAVDADLSVRDFCPAVGVAESAAAGTTNAALAVAYLAGRPVPDGEMTVRAEQGVVLGRGARIVTRLSVSGGDIIRLEVGGVARRVVEGVLTI